MRGSARVINSCLWRENLIEGNSALVAAHAVFSKLTDSVFFGGGHITDSKLSGNVFAVNADINRSELEGNIEINAENLEGKRLGVHALRIPKWLIPGNSEPISVTNKVDFSDLSLATRAFHVYDGDLWQALPNVRLCFNPAEHKKKVEHCHCLLWLPVMLTFSPVAFPPCFHRNAWKKLEQVTIHIPKGTYDEHVQTGEGGKTSTDGGISDMANALING